MHSRELSGKRGGSITSVRLLDFCGREEPYFNAQFLGDKFPTFDLLVELTGRHGSKPYFLAQVKSTPSGGNNRVADLKVQLRAQDVRYMVRCPIPTYLIGVDEKAKMAYILSIHGKLEGSISSIPKAYPLDCHNLRILHDEVATYWESLALSSGSKTSVFTL